MAIQEIRGAGSERVAGFLLALLLCLRIQGAGVLAFGRQPSGAARKIARVSERDGGIPPESNADQPAIEPGHQEPRPAALVGDAEPEAWQPPVIVLDLAVGRRLELLDGGGG